MPSSEFDPVIHQSDLKLLRQEMIAMGARLDGRIDLLRVEMFGRFDIVDQHLVSMRKEFSETRRTDIELSEARRRVDETYATALRDVERLRCEVIKGEIFMLANAL